MITLPLNVKFGVVNTVQLLIADAPYFFKVGPNFLPIVSPLLDTTVFIQATTTASPGKFFVAYPPRWVTLGRGIYYGYVTVSNLGPGTISPAQAGSTGISVTLSLPAGVTPIGGTGFNGTSFNVAIGSLAPGQSVRFLVELTNPYNQPLPSYFSGGSSINVSFY